MASVTEVVCGCPDVWSPGRTVQFDEAETAFDAQEGVLVVVKRCRCVELSGTGMAVHRTIVVVDMAGFGRQCGTNPQQIAVRDGMYDALRDAFDDAGIGWADCHREDRGDGALVLAPATVPKSLFVDVLPHTLADALAAHNRSNCARNRIRLRMALHAGEINYDRHGVTAAAINHTFRLVQADPVRDALDDSTGDVAVIVSAWFFEEVIRHSVHTDPASYRTVRVDIKETNTVGWVATAGNLVPAQLSAGPCQGPTPVPNGSVRRLPGSRRRSPRSGGRRGG